MMPASFQLAMQLVGGDLAVAWDAPHQFQCQQDGFAVVGTLGHTGFRPDLGRASVYEADRLPGLFLDGAFGAAR